MQAAKTYLEQVAKPLLPGRRIGLMHGRLSQGKAEVMAAFSAGELDVLVSTTVIEVGVDVPRAGGDGHRERRAVRPVSPAPAAGPGGPGRRAAVCILISDHEGEAVRDRLRFCATPPMVFRWPSTIWITAARRFLRQPPAWPPAHAADR